MFKSTPDKSFSPDYAKVSKIESKRYPELDVFRGLAIASVLLFHYTTRYNQIYGYNAMPFSFPYGYLGVDLFFMLSGFVIYMSLEDINNGYNFIVNRFSRLYPAYWASIGITFCLVSIFTLPGRQVSFYDAIFNLTMLQDWIGVESVDGAYWTLSHFISFYIIAFLINKLNLGRRIYLLCLIWLLMISFSKIVMDLGLKIPSQIKITFLLTEGSFFIIGILFFLTKKYGYTLSFYFIILYCLFDIYLVKGTLHFFASLFFSFLFLLATKGYLKFISLKPLTWLGSISYSLYLVHQNIGYIIINKLKILDVNFFFIIIIPTVISLLIASIVTYCIEKPARKMIRLRVKAQEEVAPVVETGSGIL